MPAPSLGPPPDRGPYPPAPLRMLFKPERGGPPPPPRALKAAGKWTPAMAEAFCLLDRSWSSDVGAGRLLPARPGNAPFVAFPAVVAAVTPWLEVLGPEALELVGTDDSLSAAP